MNLIQRYITRQVGLPVAAACSALVGIGLLSQTLDQLEIIVERGQSVWVLAQLTFLALPQLIAVVLPIGLFVGSLVALLRLQREQELISIFASGLSRWKVIMPMMSIAALAFIVILFTTVMLQPWAQRTARQKTFEIRTDLASLLIEEGQFVQGPEGLTVYVQQIEQNGLLRNLFVYVNNGRDIRTWDASEARFERIDGEPFLVLSHGSSQEYSGRGVLTQFSFNRYPFALSNFISATETVKYKPSDLWIGELANPTPALISSAGSRSVLLAEAHARLSSPLYAFTGMAIAIAAVMGGSFRRTGYTARICIAAAAFLVARILGYAVVTAASWNVWLNILQYAIPVISACWSVGILFRLVQPLRLTGGLPTSLALGPIRINRT